MKKILLIIVASILFFNFWCLKKKDETSTIKEIQSEIVIPAPIPQDANQDSSQDAQTWEAQQQLPNWDLPSWSESALIESSWTISLDAWLTWESKAAVDEIEKELEQIFKELQDE